MDQLLIKSRNCVDDTEIKENLEANFKVIDKWIKPCKIHGRKAVIASAGPSLKKNLKKIKKLQEEGVDVFCVKHSLPTLVEAGIIPTACIILDPRDFKGTSTHGIVRESLFDNAPKETMFWVASMTNQGTVQGLVDKGLNVIGWHAAVADLTTWVKALDSSSFVIMGGSSSATRGISLLQSMGYRKVVLAGFDSSLDAEPKDLSDTTEDGKPKYVPVFVKDNKFWSTGELICQSQDLERLFKMRNVDIEFENLSGGIVGTIYDIAYKKGDYLQIDDFMDSLKK